jgi:hypothetical protein
VRGALLAMIVIAGCAGSYQSARTLAPRKVSVTADVAAMSWTNAPAARPPETRGWMNGGDVAVRAGIIDRVDAGVRFGRTYESQSKGDQYSQLVLDAKRQLTPSSLPVTFSVALPVGIVWSERRDKYSDRTLALAPGVLFGYDARPEVELVVGANLLWLDPVGNDAFVRPSTSSFFGWRLTLGVRVSSSAHTWAIEPELSLLQVNDDVRQPISGEIADGGIMLSLGLGVTAGD